MKELQVQLVLILLLYVLEQRRLVNRTAMLEVPIALLNSSPGGKPIIDQYGQTFCALLCLCLLFGPY